MTAEGHDARYITIAGGGHQDPKNSRDWQAGCLGITAACSQTCQNAFETCVNTATVGGLPSHDAFKTCNSASSISNLAGCTSTCSPTLGMLSLSEQPSTVTLSLNRFGQGTLSASEQPTTSKCIAPSSPAGDMDNSTIDSDEKTCGSCGKGAPLSLSTILVAVAVSAIVAFVAFGVICSYSYNGQYQEKL